MNLVRPLSRREQGFTIVELMIATAVLSTILLLATVLITNIGNLYYKGVNQANTQDDVRNVAEQLEQDLKLNIGNTVNASASGYTMNINSQTVPVAAYCIGNGVRYTYVVGYKLNGDGGKDPLQDPVTHVAPTHIPVVLWRDDNSVLNDAATYNGPSPTPSGGCQPIDLSDPSLSTHDPSGKELISANSRLTQLSICTPSGAACSGLAGPTYKVSVGVAYGDNDLFKNQLINANTTCAGGTSDRFCATASLTSTVVQRQ